MFMNSDSHPAQDETIRSSQLSDDLIGLMTQGLDVEAGLDEVHSRSLQQRVTQMLTHGLDVNAGLAEVRSPFARRGAENAEVVEAPVPTTRRSVRQTFSRLLNPEPIIYTP